MRPLKNPRQTLSADSLYRCGAPFSRAELQVLASEGALTHVIDDVYAPSHLRRTAALRACALGLLLPRGISAGSVLCGESAAWVHLGGRAPARITLISEVFRRGRGSGAPLWQVHQVRVADTDVDHFGQIAVTSPLRTAVDLFLGVGTLDSRRALDLLIDDSLMTRRPDLLQDVLGRGPAWMTRWRLIGELLGGIDPLEALDQLDGGVREALSQRRHDRTRLPRIRILLDQCVSRRLPTVL